MKKKKLKKVLEISLVREVVQVRVDIVWIRYIAQKKSPKTSKKRKKSRCDRSNTYPLPANPNPPLLPPTKKKKKKKTPHIPVPIIYIFSL